MISPILPDAEKSVIMRAAGRKRVRMVGCIKKRGYEMKKMKTVTRTIAALMMLLLVITASGCNKKSEDVTNVTPVTDIPNTDAPSQVSDAPTAAPVSPDSAEPTKAPAPTSAPEPTAAPTAEPVPTDAILETGGNDGGTVKVASIEELLEAVRPEASILIEAGLYNIADFIDTFESDEEIKTWNEAHEYVEIEEVYDGKQLVIINVDNISISGAGPNMSAVELVTDPRYAAILTFKNCSGISLDRMTMGHTDKGDCTGNVLDLIACNSIIANELDLYGCGVYGIGTSEGTGDLFVSSSLIRDCAYGPFEIIEPKGDFHFLDCRMTGSAWGGIFDYNLSSQLAFYRCTFGEGESNKWAFADHVYMEDCVFAEVSQYPDYGEEYPDYSDLDILNLELDSVQQVPAARDMIAGTGWTALYSQDVLTDQLTYISMGSDTYRDIAFAFYTDDYLPGHGWYCYDGDFCDLTWDITDDGMIRFETDSLGTVFGSLFAAPEYEGTAKENWLRIAIGDETFWLY